VLPDEGRRDGSGREGNKRDGNRRDDNKREGNRLDGGRFDGNRREAGVVSLTYGKVTSVALDPVEKKPLYHFYPGSAILSVGSFGCNLRCTWCQNHSISMAGDANAKTQSVSPDKLVSIAEKYLPDGNIGVAFTYNEPLINFEFVRDTSKLLKERGLKSVLVTNGYINPRRFEELTPLIDAMNIDLKSISHEFYAKIGGDLSVVQQNIKTAAKSCHVEITCLLIDGENDSEDEMERMAGFIASVSPVIPLHISRFFPRFLMKDRAPTSLDNMKRFEEIAQKTLTHVHLGNV